MLFINKLVNQKSLGFFSQCLLVSKLQNLPLFAFDLDVKPKMYIKEQGGFFSTSILHSGRTLKHLKKPANNVDFPDQSFAN